MELDKLQRLIDLLRLSGITSYKDGDLELQLGVAPTIVGEEENKETQLSVVDKALGEIPNQYRALFTQRARE